MGENTQTAEIQQAHILRIEPIIHFEEGLMVVCSEYRMPNALGFLPTCFNYVWYAFIGMGLARGYAKHITDVGEHSLYPLSSRETVPNMIYVRVCDTGLDGCLMLIPSEYGTSVWTLTK